MNKMKSATETGYTTDFDFKTLDRPEGGIPQDGTFTDTRDGHVYKYKKIGEQTWMAENLAYLPDISPDSSAPVVDKHYYVYGFNGTDVKTAKNTENYQKFGVLYNWPAAINGASGSNSVPSGVQGICPAGWHLPSDAEWMILEKTLGMNDADLVKEMAASRPSGYVDKKLQSPFEWEDDDIFIGQSGFNALPGGFTIPYSKQLNQTAHFWRSTPITDKLLRGRMLSSVAGNYRATIGKSLGQSVRCVKD
jgi:uncharacterized protein (TIGR02145 family)